MNQTKHHSEILYALSCAFTAQADMPLFGTKSQPGLFAANVSGKAAASEALQAEWLTKKHTTTKGKTVVQYVGITDAGVEYLLKYSNPRPILELVQQKLAECESSLRAQKLSLQETLQTVEVLRSKIERLASVTEQQGATYDRLSISKWEDRVTRYLKERYEQKPAEDCPLPELYSQAKNAAPEISIGMFHDGLRKLTTERRIALQPWTGPLHELPEPGLALLQGHSLAYYASITE
ncbi:MAG TPA: hypothetical protein PKA06_02660 [Gemmatales bacterium]|nr:hypothetical protein [Gemmatales bacterium]HMP16070.1 hypothetical protein [Gemmatales bacterium]